jgi:hypothetical protein
MCRGELEKISVNNAKVLEKIDQALFVVSLDVSYEPKVRVLHFELFLYVVLGVFDLSCFTNW